MPSRFNHRIWVALCSLTAVAFAGGLGGAFLFDRTNAAVQPRTPVGRDATPPAQRKAPPLTSIEIADVGDMTFGSAGSGPRGGAASLLAHVTPALRSDLTVGNLETTLGSGGSSKCGAGSASCFSFQTPADTAVALRRAGFDAVNVANNHSDDYGLSGQQQTEAALRKAHLPYTGRPGQIAYLTRGGVKVALLGFAPYRYDQDLLDIPTAVALVHAAATRADLVVVFIHAGAEGSRYQHVRPGMESFLGEQRGDPIRFSHAVVDAGADLVLGSGPHVLRGMEWHRGRLIAYSFGNFTGFHTLATSGVSGLSGILRVRLREDGTFVTGRLVPIELLGAGTPALDPRHRAFGIVNTLSRSDFAGRATRLLVDGRLRAPAAAAG